MSDRLAAHCFVLKCSIVNLADIVYRSLDVSISAVRYLPFNLRPISSYKFQKHDNYHNRKD